MAPITRYQKWFSSDAFATFVVVSAVFTDNFVYDLVIPFLPQLLTSRLGIGQDQTQLWTSVLLTVYGATFLCSNLVAGYLTDRLGSKKTPFLFSILFMIAASLVFFLGKHIGLAILGRALQGVAAGFVWVSGFAFLTSHLDASNVAVCMGFVTAGMAAGEIAGPIIGGLMYEFSGYYSVLALVLSILGFDIVIRIFLKEKRPEQRCTEDGSQTVSSCRSESNLESGQRNARTASSEKDEPGLLGSTSVASDGYDASKSRSQDADEHMEQRSLIIRAKANIAALFIDPDLRLMTASFYAYAVNATIQFTIETTLAIFVQENFSWSSAASGGIIFAYLGPTLLSPIIAPFIERHGPRWASVTFFLLNTCILIILGALIHLDYFLHPSTEFRVLFVILIVLFGICIAVLTSSNIIGFSVVAKRREDRLKREHGKMSSTGMSFGWLQIAWALGMVIGPVISEAFLGTTGWLGLCVFLASLSFVSGVVMAFTWRKWEAPAERELIT